MKPRNFVYVGNPIPKTNTSKHKDFIIHLQKSMLLSLVKRGLLTTIQMNSVMSEIESKYHNSMR